MPHPNVSDPTLQRPEVSVRHVTSGLAIGSVALLVVGLQPLLLGELLEAERVTLEGVGIVAMAEIVALGLGVLVGNLLLPLHRLREVTLLAAALAILLDIVTLRAGSDLGFALTRAGAGLAEGALLWVTTALIVRTPGPDRVAGIFFVVQTAAQALAGLLLAQVVIPAHGWQGALQTIAAATVLPMLLAAALPRAVLPLAPPSQTGFRWSLQTARPLAVAFFQLATLGALWAYLEPLGQRAGMSSRAVQTLIAAALGVQIAGGLAGSALVRRLSPRAALAGSSALLLVLVIALQRCVGNAGAAFVPLCAGFAFVWLFTAPYQTGLAFEADGSGRVAALTPVAQLLGIAAGPLTASFVVHGDDAAAVPLVSATFAMLSLAVLATAARRLR
jgi:predicted MFS family arabinose efflux permease